MNDSQEYRNKKKLFDSMITLYGRNVAQEVLEDKAVSVHKLHLSRSNKPDGIIATLERLAQERGIEVVYHTKEALSRISKNAKQDQGVAVDILSTSYRDAQTLSELKAERIRLLALDGIQNPQNLGMIIRSAAAGNIDGIILPRRSSAKLSPLVMKASAGTLFKIPIYYCEALEPMLQSLNEYTKMVLSSHAKADLHEAKIPEKTIFVLGNESEGVSPEVAQCCDAAIRINMRRGVESLNVAVTAALLAFLP